MTCRDTQKGEIKLREIESYDVKCHELKRCDMKYRNIESDDMKYYEQKRGKMNVMPQKVVTLHSITSKTKLLQCRKCEKCMCS